MRVQSVEDAIADIHDMIAKRAYEKFLERGSHAGLELLDWVSAEAELIFHSRAGVWIDNNHVVAEIIVPNVDPARFYASVTPREILVQSYPDEQGRQVFQTVYFPEEIALSDVTAEYVLDTLFITAAVSNSIDRSLKTAQVA